MHIPTSFFVFVFFIWWMKYLLTLVATERLMCNWVCLVLCSIRLLESAVASVTADIEVHN